MTDKVAFNDPQKKSFVVINKKQGSGFAALFKTKEYDGIAQITKNGNISADMLGMFYVSSAMADRFLLDGEEHLDLSVVIF